MQADVSELRLTDDIITGMGGADANVKSEMSSDLDENLPLETVEIEADLKSRSRGDFSLYKYLSGMISKKKTIFWLVSLLVMVGAERFPGKYYTLCLSFISKLIMRL
jgi:hypothetical protein